MKRQNSSSSILGMMIVAAIIGDGVEKPWEKMLVNIVRYMMMIGSVALILFVSLQNSGKSNGYLGYFLGALTTSFFVAFLVQLFVLGPIVIGRSKGYTTVRSQFGYVAKRMALFMLPPLIVSIILGLWAAYHYHY